MRPLRPAGAPLATAGWVAGWATGARLSLTVFTVVAGATLVVSCWAIAAEVGAASLFVSSEIGNSAIGTLTTTSCVETQPKPPSKSGTAIWIQLLSPLRPRATKISRGSAFPMIGNCVFGPERIFSREPLIATWAVG